LHRRRFGVARREMERAVRPGERLYRTPEEWKAWSQNLGHESEVTTFVGHGHVPTHRQAEIIQSLASLSLSPCGAPGRVVGRFILRGADPRATATE
jgi:hypothetical protein